MVGFIRMRWVLTCLKVPKGASSPIAATKGGAYLATTLLGFPSSSSSRWRGVTRTVKLINPPLNSVTSNLRRLKTESGLDVSAESGGNPKTLFKAPPSRNLLKSNNNRPEEAPSTWVTVRVLESSSSWVFGGGSISDAFSAVASCANVMSLLWMSPPASQPTRIPKLTIWWKATLW